MRILIKKDRQLVIATHDESFFELVKKKMPADVFNAKYLKLSSRNGEYVNSSCNFHLSLALLTENELLINAITPLISLSILARLVYEDSICLFNSYDEHNELINAIKTNDIEYSKSVMNYHLHHCLEALNFNETPKQISPNINLKSIIN